MAGVLDDEPMSDVDAVVWHVEQRPRDRTTIAALALFDGPVDPARLRHRVDRASRVLPRLRQRVVADSSPPAPPRWTIDPEFRLSAHLRRTRLHGGEHDLLQLTRDLVAQPFDRTRPLWEITHVTDIDGGGEAVLVKSHHSLSDGVGGAAMMLELFELDPQALSRHPLSRPAAPQSADQEPAATPCRVDDLVAASYGLGELVGSAVQMLRPRATPRAVAAHRSDGLDLRRLSVALDGLRAAGRRVDGTINDAFVTAVTAGARRHFPTDVNATLRVAVPINTRTDGSTTGNQWTPGRIDVGATDTMADVRRRLRRARHAPAHRLLGPVAAGLRRLPPSATAMLATSLGVSHDIAASNVAGSPVPLHLCGEAVAALVPFGPLSGAAVNVTLLSHAGTAHIGVASDPAVVTDPDALAADLRAAFAEVIEGPT